MVSDTRSSHLHPNLLAPKYKPNDRCKKHETNKEKHDAEPLVAQIVATNTTKDWILDKNSLYIGKAEAHMAQNPTFDGCQQSGRAERGSNMLTSHSKRLTPKVEHLCYFSGLRFVACQISKTVQWRLTIM